MQSITGFPHITKNTDFRWLVTLRNHDIMIFGRMNEKLLQKLTSWKTQWKHVNQIKKLFIEVVVQRFLEVNPGKYTKEVTDFEKYIEI